MLGALMVSVPVALYALYHKKGCPWWVFAVLAGGFFNWATGYWVVS